ncbi:MAG: putative glycoside hydrolase [Candidatus Brocadiia bacterium]
MEGQEFELQNASQTMSFRVNETGIFCQISTDSGDSVSGQLVAQHMFYVDERNNMDPFALDDRLTYESEHLRDPLVFFQDGSRVEVMQDGAGDSQCAIFREEQGGWTATVAFESSGEDPYFSADLRFTNTVPARFGHEVSPNIPEWAKELRPVTFPKRVAPIGDDLWKDYFEWAHEMGFNAAIGFGWMWKRYQDVICAIAPENETLALDSEHGATEKSVRRHNEMLHELGMKSIVWTPTTGASSYAPICEEHPEWFVRDEDGKLRSSWRDENGDPWLVDSNPFSEGYHRYWRDLIFQIADWGFDGVFLDGVIARPSDAFSRPYPGRVHDGMYSAIRRLRRELDEAGLQDFLIKPESGDVMLADSVYWMNMPRLNPEHPLAPSRDMPEALRDSPRYFLDPECPTIEKSQISEHLELIGRSWPEGMPGNWGVGYESAGELTEYDFAKLELRCTFGSVVGIGLLKAREDPNFEHFAPETNGELPAAKAELNRKFFKRLKELSVLRAKHPALSRGRRDFDTIRSDNGAVPAFVRSDGNEDFLIVANLSGETLEITLQLMDEEPQPPFSEQGIQVRNPLSGAEQTFKKDSLREGMSLELEENEVKIWQVTASGQKR